jgi:hypothetical protein
MWWWGPWPSGGGGSVGEEGREKMGDLCGCDRARRGLGWDSGRGAREMEKPS